MSSRLMIVVTTISIVGSSLATGALAAPHHTAGEARYFSGANSSEESNAFVGEVNRSGYGFGDHVSKPQYRGGPKSSY